MIRWFDFRVVSLLLLLNFVVAEFVVVVAEISLIIIVVESILLV